MEQIQNIINNRVALKFNHIHMSESGTTYIYRNDEQGINKALYEVKSKLLNNEFDNIINVFVEGANGQCGPNVSPSKKAIKRLTSIINGSSYRIVQQKGQYFTLEGMN